MIQILFNTQTQSGLLAVAPLLLIISSYEVGISLGLVLFALIFILTSALYLIRNLIPASQRVVVVLITSISMLLISRMFLSAESFSTTETIGLFFPLILVNSLTLSHSESVFSKRTFQSVIRNAFGVGITVLVLFIVFGFLRESLVTFSIMGSPAGCLFLLGLMFALCNVVSRTDVTD